MIRKFRKQQRICGASSASIAKLVARGKLHTRAAARALAVLSGRRSARGQAIDVTVRISQGGRSTFRSRPDEPNHLIISNHNPSCRDGVFVSIRTIRKISEPKNLANAFVRVTVVTRNSGMFSLTEKARLFLFVCLLFGQLAPARRPRRSSGACCTLQAHPRASCPLMICFPTRVPVKKTRCLTAC